MKTHDLATHHRLVARLRQDGGRDSAPLAGALRHGDDEPDDPTTGGAAARPRRIIVTTAIAHRATAPTQRLYGPRSGLRS